MDAASTKALAAFGFLTVLESPDHGLFGGYLVLSPQGRPLEFRCSTPVTASRAQEILYGPTLRPYLFAEVIGRALIAGAELHATAILTDQRDMLPLSLLRPEEILLVRSLTSESALPEIATTLSISAKYPLPEDGAVSVSPSASGAAAGLIINGCEIIASSTSSRTVDELARMLEPLACNVFLAEPFQRIRAALTEAQLASHDAAEYPHDRAAA
ncbi:hypothetical protein [Lacipirellula parvula]|nr:hypothetical protein [Lacipirellula parvula]